MGVFPPPCIWRKYFSWERIEMKKAWIFCFYTEKSTIPHLWNSFENQVTHTSVYLSCYPGILRSYALNHIWLTNGLTKFQILLQGPWFSQLLFPGAEHLPPIYQNIRIRDAESFTLFLQRQFRSDSIVEPSWGAGTRANMLCLEGLTLKKNFCFHDYLLLDFAEKAKRGDLLVLIANSRKKKFKMHCIQNTYVLKLSFSYAYQMFQNPLVCDI